MDEHELLRVAAALARPFVPNADCSSATVAAALLTREGNVYTGVCIDLRCGLGWCAERSAAAEMLKARETKIAVVVAVHSTGKIVPPCGACREFLLQLNEENAETWVVLGEGHGRALKELLP